ncbi:MAG: hypothetical protein IJX77_07715 [Ruminococcus sp.]|nr:hypothetical protein [Ruminococcus sp.]
MEKETKKVGAMTASELADMIDKLMAGGNGSVNVSALEDGDGFAVTTVNSRECGGKKGACCQPTELETEED